jgi:hypothetical protein
LYAIFFFLKLFFDRTTITKNLELDTQIFPEIINTGLWIYLVFGSLRNSDIILIDKSFVFLTTLHCDLSFFNFLKIPSAKMIEIKVLL